MSSDNFKELYKKYATEKTRYGSPEWTKWWSNVGLYYGKEIPLEDSFKTSCGDHTLSLTRYLKDCTSPEPITKDWETEKKEVLSQYWISREIPKKYCEIFAPNVNAKCLDLKVIELMVLIFSCLKIFMISFKMAASPSFELLIILGI